MTCKEKIKIKHPHLAREIMTGSCPSDYMDVHSPDYCEWPIRHSVKCKECWNREIPENNEINKENEEMNENTCPNYAPREEAPRTRTSREIEEEMLRLRAEHYDRMTALAKELEETKKIEALEEAAAELKRVVDAYVKAGFTREEAMALVNNAVKALAP